LRSLAWTAYIIAQGSVMFGIWVLAHECGHGAISDYQVFNDCIGWVVHSLLFVPYFSWKISHKSHHSKTGNMDRDEPHVPALGVNPPGVKPTVMNEDRVVELDLGEEDDMLTHKFLFASLWRWVYRASGIFTMLLLGWPLYLGFNAHGNKTYAKESPGAWVNHYSPWSPIYTSSWKHQALVLLSDVGILGTCTMCYLMYQHWGFALFLKVYFVPYLVNNLWLVLVTYLHHTHPGTPVYNDATWDHTTGAFSTIDRSYGILDVIQHHIADTHVVHHLFSEMPHYHASAATKKLRDSGLVDGYYRFDPTPVWVAVWHGFRRCSYVTEDPTHKGVFWYDTPQWERA